MAEHEHTKVAHGPAQGTIEEPGPRPAEGTHLHPTPVVGLTVGHAADAAEVAAEARATSVLGRLRRFGAGSAAAGPAASTAPASAMGAGGGTVDAGRSAQISAQLGGGSPLPSPVKGRMESGFGASLDHVRVHDGPEAARHSAALGAQAFTVGNDVFLGTGKVGSGGAHGEHVLAHELAHVLANDSGQHVRRMPPANPTPKALADRISKGHAYQKHVVDQAEYTAENITDQAGFATLIEDVIENGVTKDLSGGRKAYWKDRTVTIYDPASGDLGTAFAPKKGKSYYDNLT